MRMSLWRGENLFCESTINENGAISDKTGKGRLLGLCSYSDKEICRRVCWESLYHWAIVKFARPKEVYSPTRKHMCFFKNSLKNTKFYVQIWNMLQSVSYYIRNMALCPLGGRTIWESELASTFIFLNLNRCGYYMWMLWESELA